MKGAMFTNEFAKSFRSIDYTIHPADIPGEVAGKGSNAAWAARKISEKYSIEQRKDVIITGIDGTCTLPSASLVAFQKLVGGSRVFVAAACLALCTS